MFGIMQQMEPGGSPGGREGADAGTLGGDAGLILLADGGPHVLAPRVLARMLRDLLTPAARIQGVDARLDDPALGVPAAAFVMVLPPLGNLDNPFYRVHRRRNDRFLAARPRLRALYPEVDFTEFDFTGHMLGTLSAICAARFALVQRCLADGWRGRMSQVLTALPVRGVVVALPQADHLCLPDLPLPGGVRHVTLDPATPVPEVLGTALADALGLRA